MKEKKDMKEMKAVVLEINEGKATVLDRSGRYHKIPSDGRFEVGCEMILPHQLSRHYFKPAKIASIAAAFIISFTSLGAYTYSLPYSYMEVDINPSVQFTANIYNRIIKVESFNKDGEDIITGNSYRNMSLKNGLSHLLEKAEEKGYISDEKENAVLVTVSSRSKNRADDIITEANNSIKKEREKKENGSTKKNKGEETTPGSDTNTDGDKGKNTGVENACTGTAVIAEEVPMELLLKQVEKSAPSPGRTALVEKLISENPELDAEELKNASVKELVESIKEIRKQEKEKAKRQKEEERQKAKESREKAKQEEKARKQQEKEDKERDKNNSRGQNRGNG